MQPSMKPRPPTFSYAAPMSDPPSLDKLARRRDLMAELAATTAPPPMFNAGQLGINLGAQALRQWAASRAEDKYEQANKDVFGQLANLLQSDDSGAEFDSQLLPLLASVGGPEAGLQYALSERERRQRMEPYDKMASVIFGDSELSPATDLSGPAQTAGSYAMPAAPGVLPAALYGESSFGADTTNPSSNAMGRLQITPATWAEYAPRVGAPPEFDPSTPEGQAILDEWEDDVGGEVWKDYASMAERDFGRPPTSAENYLYWFFGPGDAPKVFAARPDVDIRQVISPLSYQQNRAFLQGKTTGQAIDELTRRWNGWEVQAGGATEAASASSAHSDADKAQGLAWFQSLPDDRKKIIQARYEIDRAAGHPERTIDFIMEQMFAEQKPPTIRTFHEGGMSIDKAWSPAAGEWVPVGKSYPRWKDGDKGSEPYFEVVTLDDGSQAQRDARSGRLYSMPDAGGAVYEIVEGPNGEPVQRNTKTGYLASVPGGSSGPSAAAQANNEEILAAREALAGMTVEEIRAASSPADATGILENPDYNPAIESMARLALQHLQGVEDPDYRMWHQRLTGLGPDPQGSGQRIGVAVGTAESYPSRPVAPPAAAPAAAPAAPAVPAAPPPADPRPFSSTQGGGRGRLPSSATSQGAAPQPSASGGIEVGQTVYIGAQPAEVLAVLPDGRVRVRMSDGTTGTTREALAGASAAP